MKSFIQTPIQIKNIHYNIINIKEGILFSEVPSGKNDLQECLVNINTGKIVGQEKFYSHEKLYSLKEQFIILKNKDIINSILWNYVRYSVKNIEETIQIVFPVCNACYNSIMGNPEENILICLSPLCNNKGECQDYHFNQDFHKILKVWLASTFDSPIADFLKRKL